MKKIFSREVLIGLLVIIALAVLFVGIDFLKGMNVFEKENTYHISYENVQGLSVSAPVTVNGYKVGLVRSIAYEYDNPGHVRVDIDIDDEMHLPNGTVAELSSDLLGTASIALKLGEGTEWVKPGSALPGVVPSGMMDMVSQSVLPAVSSIFPKIDSLLSNVNKLVADPALQKSIERLDVLTSNLVTTTVQLNRVMASLPPITEDVKAISGNFVQTSADLGVLAEKMSAMPVDSLMSSLQNTIDNLKAVTAELNAGLADPNSTLGKVMHDPSLYDNLNRSIQSLDSLFVDIKKNPKRYISIKLL